MLGWSDEVRDRQRPIEGGGGFSVEIGELESGGMVKKLPEGGAREVEENEID